VASFPVQYSEQFYRDVIQRNDGELNKFAYYQNNDVVVGALCARLEDLENNGQQQQQQQQQRLYIMTLAVLAAYRGRGIGSQLLQSVLDYCEKRAPTIAEIALHVQISNRDALRFYQKFGFVQGEMVENYYRRIDPPHCYLVYKKLEAKEESSKENNAHQQGNGAETDKNKAWHLPGEI
jgi:ribosomal protein S18 acetylase RimI-like enzyme